MTAGGLGEGGGKEAAEKGLSRVLGPKPRAGERVATNPSRAAKTLAERKIFFGLARPDQEKGGGREAVAEERWGSGGRDLGGGR